MMLAMLRCNINGLLVRFRDIRFHGEHVGRLARIGLPAAIDGLIAWSSHILFIRVISRIGDTAFAAHYVGIQFECLPVGILGGIVFSTCAVGIYRLMTTSPEIQVAGVEAMPILAWCQIPLVVGIVYIHGLRGAGETRLPLILAVVSTAGLRTPIAYLCGILWNGGLPGAWLGMLADVTVRGILGAWLYSRGRWTHLKI